MAQARHGNVECTDHTNQDLEDSMQASAAKAAQLVPECTSSSQRYHGGVGLNWPHGTEVFDDCVCGRVCSSTSMVRVGTRRQRSQLPWRPQHHLALMAGKSHGP